MKEGDPKAISTARVFLEQAASGKRGEALAPYFYFLQPYLDICIKGVASRWRGPLPISLGDLSQAVYEKFLTHPPEKTGAENPLARIQAWANVTAFNLLVTEKRKERVRAVRSEEMIGQASAASSENCFAENLEMRLENLRFVRHLELEGSQKLVEAARIVFETGLCDSRQLGAILKISPAAAYKRLQRLRLARTIFDSGKDKKER
jgi:hypothetical protein